MKGIERKLSSFTNALMPASVNLTPKAKENQVAPLILKSNGKNAAFQNVVRHFFFRTYCSDSHMNFSIMKE